MPLIGGLRESFRHVPRTLALVWRASRAGTAALAATTLVSALVPLLLAYGGKRTVDALVARDRDEALTWVAFELAVVVVQALAQRGQALVRALLGSRLALDTNVRILEKAAGLELRHFEDPEFYDRLTRARREASSRPIAVVAETFALLQGALTLAGYVVLLVQFSGLAVVGLVLAAVPGTVAELRFSTLAFRLRNRRAPETRRLNYLEHVLANEAHAKEVKLFGLGPLLLERYRATGEAVHAEDRALVLRRAAWGAALAVLSTVALYGCYAWLAIAAATGLLSIGDLTMYLVAFRHGQQAFQALLGTLGGMYEHDLYMSNLFAFLDLAPTSRPEPVPTPRSGALARAPERGVRFEQVGYRYPGQDAWALRGVDLTIPPGQSLALVGQNGSGKTTLVKLLTGLYEPTEGRVLLDGRDVRDLDPDDLRRRIGVIFQDFNRYQLALRENVGFGSVAHLHDEARLRRAVDNGGAADIVAGLPAGLDQVLGRQFKLDGVELSGGQWQRVGLARAFHREEADMLVLDEPTAALDAEAEQAVFERFRALARGRTTLLISHRFPTVRTADRIVVLEAGRILEQGTHDELLAREGRYARLFRLQAAGYQ